MNIQFPWVIMHQPGGQGAPLETILAGPEGIGDDELKRCFALAAADLIRHIAVAAGCEDADILALVEAELGRPTTDITRTGPN